MWKWRISYINVKKNLSKEMRINRKTMNKKWNLQKSAVPMRWDEQSKKTLFPRGDDMKDFHIWFYLSLRTSYWWDNFNQNRIHWHICRWTCDIKYSIIVLDFFMCLIQEKCDGWSVTILRTDFSIFVLKTECSDWFFCQRSSF